MGAYFLDSSGLAKCYLQEVGTAWMRQLIDPAAGHEIIVLRLSEVEVASGLARRRRNGLLTAADEQQLLIEMRAHFAARFDLIDSPVKSSRLPRRWLVLTACVRTTQFNWERATP